MKNLQLFLLLNCGVVFNLFTQIHTVFNLNEVLSYLSISKKQLVVFDIDNTLLRAPTHLGSDQWISAIVKHNMTNGMSCHEAWSQILPLYFHIHKYIDLVPTEDNVVDTISEIEKICKHTICLTARCPINMVEITCQQLAKNRLIFQVPEIDHLKLTLPGNSVYQNGVLFCGNNCKGDVLMHFLKACHYSPDEIILVDDKLYNLEAVAKQLANFNISFVGLRYAGCDSLIADLNLLNTNEELDIFLEQYPGFNKQQ